jgi:hypothetical protein
MPADNPPQRRAVTWDEMRNSLSWPSPYDIDDTLKPIDPNARREVEGVIIVGPPS